MPKFGDKIVNPHVDHEHPRKVGIFVRTKKRTGKVNPGEYYELTDGQGNFWEMHSRHFEAKK